MSRGLVKRNPNITLDYDMRPEAIFGGFMQTRGGCTLTGNTDGTVTYGGTTSGDPAMTWLGVKTGQWYSGRLMPAGSYTLSVFSNASSSSPTTVQGWLYDSNNTYSGVIGELQLKNGTLLRRNFTLSAPRKIAIGAGVSGWSVNPVTVPNTRIGLMLTPAGVEPTTFEPTYFVPTKAYVGDTEVKQAYVGDVQVFPIS